MTLKINTSYMTIILKGGLLALFCPAFILSFTLFSFSMMLVELTGFQEVFKHLDLFFGMWLLFFLTSCAGFLLVGIPVVILAERFKTRSLKVYTAAGFFGGAVVAIVWNMIFGDPSFNLLWIGGAFYGLFVSTIFWYWGVQKLP